MRDRLAQPFGDDRLRGRPSVGRLTRQHLIQDRCQAVLIGPPIELGIRGGLLGAHVRRRAEGEPGLGEPLAPRRAHRQRDPKVRHHGLALVQHDVLGLDIAMDGAASVCEVEGRGDRPGNAQRLIERQRAFLLKALAEAPALDVRHHVIDEAIRLAGIDERQDVGVLELRREPDLAQEPLGAEEGGKFRAEHLDCDQAVVLQIASEIDRGHPAATEFALDRVAARKGRPHAL